MNIYEITFFAVTQQPNPPFKTIIKPSIKTLSFLTKFFNDEYFQGKVAEIRKKHNIPVEAFEAKLLKKYKQPSITFDDPLLNGTYNIKRLRKELSPDLDEILTHYNFDPSLKFNLFLLISHNAFIEFESKDNINLAYYSGKESIQSILKFYNDPIGVIVFKSRVTKQQLKEWVDENWNKYEYGGIEGNLRSIMPIIPSEKGTYINAQFDKQIFDLKEAGKSYEKISDLLFSKYSLDKFADISWLKTRYSRFKKRN